MRVGGVARNQAVRLGRELCLFKVFKWVFEESIDWFEVIFIIL